MSKETDQHSLEILLRGVGECLLQEEGIVNVDDPRTQKLLTKVFDLSSAFCLEGMEISLRIPTLFFVRQGLVSPEIVKEIKLLPEPEAEKRFNFITIRKIPGGFEFGKTHYKSEFGWVGEREARRDILVEEKTTLTTLEKRESIIVIKQGYRVKEEHYHINDRKFIPEQVPVETEDFVKEEVTGRSLNRLLASVVEGISPGFFGNFETYLTS